MDLPTSNIWDQTFHCVLALSLHTVVVLTQLNFFLRASPDEEVSAVELLVISVFGCSTEPFMRLNMWPTCYIIHCQHIIAAYILVQICFPLLFSKKSPRWNTQSWVCFRRPAHTVLRDVAPPCGCATVLLNIQILFPILDPVVFTLKPIYCAALMMWYSTVVAHMIGDIWSPCCCLCCHEGSSPLFPALQMTHDATGWQEKAT